jgi:ADP-heptose:LPS heptosyltransferase
LDDLKGVGEVKTLVISMLRLGDVVLATPVIDGLRRAEPDSEIHLLMNAQFKKISSLIPSVDSFKYFDREMVQKGLGEADRALIESYDRLNRFIKEINAENYDRVINLTGNRLSGWLASLIDCNERKGATIGSNGAVEFGSPWFKYLNDYVTLTEREIFHYIDIFFYGSGLFAPVRRIQLVESEEGVEEALQFAAENEDFILVQALTSEDKKNWGKENFIEALCLYHELHPKQSILLLAAPDEKEQIQGLVDELLCQGINAKLADVSLAGAFSLLKRCRLIITGDTSIKHLACAAKAKIVELSVGSSSYQKTGAYLSGSIILQSKEPCAPCSHSGPCRYSENICAKRIPPELVSLVSSSLVENNLNDIRILAHEYKKDVDVVRTYVTEQGDWIGLNLSEDLSDQAIARWIDRSSWKMLLNNEDSLRVAPFGSESLIVSRLLKKAFPEQEKYDWVESLGRLNSNFTRFEDRVSDFLNEMRGVIKNHSNENFLDAFTERLIVFSENLKESSYFSSYVEPMRAALEGAEDSSFIRIKNIRESLTTIHRRVKIQQRLIQSLHKHLVEGL